MQSDSNAAITSNWITHAASPRPLFMGCEGCYSFGQ